MFLQIHQNVDGMGAAGQSGVFTKIFLKCMPVVVCIASLNFPAVSKTKNKNTFLLLMIFHCYQ